MRRISRGLAGVIGLAVGAASAISPAAAQQGPAQAPPSASQEPVRVINVTLVTGDVVHLTTYRDHRQTAAAERGPASGRGGFQIVERDGHMFVTPYAAMPYLARGLVDETLFDVTELASQGYDDTHARSLPLILEYATNPASVAATRSLLAQPVPAQAHRVRNLPSVGSVAVRVPRTGLGRFWEAVDDDRPAAEAGTVTCGSGKLSAGRTTKPIHSET